MSKDVDVGSRVKSIAEGSAYKIEGKSLVFTGFVICGSVYVWVF
jgi:hypothetical protein